MAGFALRRRIRGQCGLALPSQLASGSKNKGDWRGGRGRRGRRRRQEKQNFPSSMTQFHFMILTTNPEQWSQNGGSRSYGSRLIKRREPSLEVNIAMPSSPSSRIKTKPNSRA